MDKEEWDQSRLPGREVIMAVTTDEETKEATTISGKVKENGMAIWEHHLMDQGLTGLKGDRTTTGVVMVKAKEGGLASTYLCQGFRFRSGRVTANLRL